MKSYSKLLICIVWCSLCFAWIGCRTIRVPPAKAVPTKTTLLPLELGGVRDQSPLFSNTFCSVMVKEFEEWGPCDQYIEGAEHPQISDLPSLPTNYRLVIVAGFLSSCSSKFGVFSEGIKHLHEAHQIEVTTARVDGFGSTANNAQQILTYLQNLPTDGRLIVLLGYSKGATDIQHALAIASPELKQRIAGFISLSGMIGGSHLYDVFDTNPDKLLEPLDLGPCGPNSGGFAALSRANRQEFLKAHPPEADIPSYSLASVSTKENTSKVLRPFWKYLSAYGQEQDSQMMFPEQILPGSIYLGTAKADHWAVAIPFEDDPALRSKIDRNHFPRTVLLESLLRFAVATHQQTGRVSASTR
jgi:hypothetical protein